MATNPHPRAESVSTVSSLGYVDDFLTIFDRPKKTQILKRAIPVKPIPSEKTSSTENLLRKPPVYQGARLESKGNAWNSGFLKRIPYSGGLAILAVIICAAADGLILWKSDGQDINSWIVSPSVLLAILSATANVCLEYAHSQGVIISWWRKALRGGTLNDLNYTWEYGDSLLAAGTAGRRFNFVAFATLAASAIVIDGPLLQKASTIISKEMTQQVNVTALIAEELPYGYTGSGVILASPLDDMVMSEAFIGVTNDYATRAPIISNFTGCSGVCSGTVRAAGLAVNCTETPVPWNSNDEGGSEVFSSKFNWYASQSDGFRMGDSQNYTNGTHEGKPFKDFPLIDLRLVYATNRTSGMGVYNDSNGDPHYLVGALIGCNGTLVSKRCSMRSATLDYPVKMINNTIILSRGSSEFSVNSVQAVGNDTNFFNHHDLNKRSFITLGGVAKVAQNMFGSNAHQDEGGIFITISGNLANQYLTYGYGYSSFFETQDGCSINWMDPTSDIVDALNEMMFRTALTASKTSKFAILNSSIVEYRTSYYEMLPVNWTDVESGMPIPQTIPMSQSSQIIVFQSHYEFLAAALAVMMLGVIFVIPLFDSFWQFGRDVSLNPLEIAKAFNAEILREQGSNSTLKHLARKFGDKEVKYGEIIDGEDKSIVGGFGVSGRRRLELADPSRVREPQFQALYS